MEKPNYNEMNKIYGLNNGPRLIVSGFNGRTLFVTPVNGLVV